MDLRNRRELKHAAAHALDQTPANPKRLILIHTAVSLGLMLLVVVLDFVLSNQIENTGGLSGLQTRSVLTTVQSVLQLVQMVALPFWEIGYLFVALKLADRKSAEPLDLLEGFRKFGPFFRCMLLQTLIVAVLVFLCIYVGSRLFMLTPFAEPMMETLYPIVNDTALMESAAGEEVLMQAVEQAIQDSIVPLASIIGLLFSVIYIPIAYRLRMVNYSLLEYPQERVRVAFRRSFRLMRGNCMALFRLDLSFWWYYLLQVLLNVICYGDVLLPMAGITLPWSGDISFFLFYLLALGGQFVLYLMARNQVEVTYAQAYRSLSPSTPPHQTEV